MFDEAIFQGLEADNRHNSCRLQTGVCRPFQKGFQLSQFLVDHDAERLKNTRGGMPLTFRRFPSETCGFDRGRKVATGANGVSQSPLDQVAGQAATVRLFAELEQDVRELSFIDACQPAPGRFPLRDVKPEIERPVRPETEPALFVGQLDRRQPKIEQDAIDCGNMQLFQNVRKLRVAGVDEVSMRRRNGAGGNFQHFGVAVKTDQAPLVANSV